MGVLYNVYCIRPEHAPRPALRDIVARLHREGLVRGEVVHGPARRDMPGVADPWLLSPETAGFVYESESMRFRAFASPEEAAAGLVDEDDCAVSMSALARGFRSDPTHFYDHPAGIGIYRVSAGHRLVVGKPEDMSDLVDEFPELAAQMNEPPRFDGVVHEWIWLHGKNAPLEEDFVGSKLHRAIERMWPGVRVIADEWL